MNTKIVAIVVGIIVVAIIITVVVLATRSKNSGSSNDNTPSGPSNACNPACTGNTTCQNGRCICVPNCANKQCGSDGCGSNCGSCLPEQECQSGQCITPQPETCNPSCGTGYVCQNDVCVLTKDPWIQVTNNIPATLSLQPTVNASTPVTTPVILSTATGNVIDYFTATNTTTVTVLKPCVCRVSYSITFTATLGYNITTAVNIAGNINVNSYANIFVPNLSYPITLSNNFLMDFRANTPVQLVMYYMGKDSAQTINVQSAVLSIEYIEDG